MSALLAASLLGSMLPGKEVMRAGKRVVRAGTGYNNVHIIMSNSF